MYEFYVTHGLSWAIVLSMSPWLLKCVNLMQKCTFYVEKKKTFSPEKGVLFSFTWKIFDVVLQLQVLFLNIVNCCSFFIIHILLSSDFIIIRPLAFIIYLCRYHMDSFYDCLSYKVGFWRSCHVSCLIDKFLTVSFLH